MTNLTEQWKNGTLTDGRYYVKLTSGKIIIDDYSHEVFHTIWRNMVKEILAPFPTFEEWQAMENENEVFKDALEDIGYCKSWIYQNRPSELVGWALDALKGRAKPQMAEELEALKNQLKIARGALAFYEKNKHFASSKQDRQYFENFSHSYHGFSCYMWSDPLERFSLKVESGGIARQALAQMDEVKGGAQ